MSTPQDAHADFEPTALAIIQKEGEVLIAATDAHGAFSGVVCPPDAVEVVRELLPAASASLLEFWKQYNKSKGAGPFFWDIIEIAQAIRDLEAVPGIRRLASFSTESDLCHNNWQAQFMRVAAAQSLQPEIVQEDPRRRLPDFRLGNGLDAEIKTVFSETGIEMDTRGMRIAPEDVTRLTRVLRDKVADAKGQIGAHGVIIVALWCDLAANFISAVTDARPIDMIGFQPGTIILGLAPSYGEHPYTALSIPIEHFDDFLNTLAQRLGRFETGMPAPFTGRHVASVAGPGWMSIGRSVRIASWENAYAPYERASSSAWFAALTPQQRDILVQGRDGLERSRALWTELTAANPITGESHTLEDLRTDPRFNALFGWAQWLCDTLIVLGQTPPAFSAIFINRPKTDAIQLMAATYRPEGPIDGLGLLSIKRVVSVMHRLSDYLLETLPRR